MKKIKRTPHPFRILTPEEFEALLTNAIPKLLPVIALGGFSGLRTGEIFDLDWSAIDLDKKTVLSGGIKTFHRRIVPLPDAAVAWLKPIAKDSGPVVPYRSSNALLVNMGQVWKALGIKRETNILRLSACSYMFALSGRAKKTAKELGSSPVILIEYLPHPHKADAVKWFSIFPPEQKPPEG